MCVVMDTVHYIHTYPLAVFEQAAKVANYMDFPRIAREAHKRWLLYEEVPPFVNDFCHRVLSTKKRHRRH